MRTLRSRILCLLMTGTIGLAGTLSGCGGGSSDSVALTDGPVVPAAVSGVVADGYLSGATVCLDVNANKKCDVDEPVATSGAGGKFTIDADELAKLPAGGLPADYPVLVEVPATAIDEDTNAAVGKAYVLAAPAGKPEFVSPMTTLVQNQIESNPSLSAEDAETQVKAQTGIGSDSSLFEDYVTPKTEGFTEAQVLARQVELAKVHKVARVVATTMADMKTTVEQAAQTAGVDLEANLDALAKIVVEEVMNRLQNIVVAVEAAVEAEAGGQEFDPDTVATTVETEVGPVDTSTIETEIEEKKTVIAKSSFEKMLLEGGTYWLDHWVDYNMSRFEYGNVTLVDGRPVDTHYEWMNGAWQLDADPESPDYLLTANGWVQYSDEAANYEVLFNADGTATLMHTGSGMTEKLSAVELDLAGKSHGAFAGDMGMLLLDPAVTFPAGAKAYRMTFAPQQDIYQVDTWTNDSGVDDNYVRYWDQNGDVVLTGLAEVRSAFAKDSNNYLEVEWEDEYSLAVQFGAGGELYLFKRTRDRSQPPVALTKTGTWTEAQVFGETLLKLAIPDSIRVMFRLDGVPFFVVKDQVVKRGESLPAGVIETEDGLNFNKAAFDSLVGNVNFDYVPDYATGSSPAL